VQVTWAHERSCQLSKKEDSVDPQSMRDKYDLSMPVKDMYSLVEEARERFAEKGLDKDGSIITWAHEIKSA
jgi:hypothetical protein